MAERGAQLEGRARRGKLSPACISGQCRCPWRRGSGWRPWPPRPPPCGQPTAGRPYVAVAAADAHPFGWPQAGTGRAACGRWRHREERGLEVQGHCLYTLGVAVPAPSVGTRHSSQTPLGATWPWVVASPRPPRPIPRPTRAKRGGQRAVVPSRVPRRHRRHRREKYAAHVEYGRGDVELVWRPGSRHRGSAGGRDCSDRTAGGRRALCRRSSRRRWAPSPTRQLAAGGERRPVRRQVRRRRVALSPPGLPWSQQG